MDIYAKMAESIITSQESIMGPIALEQAKKVNGLAIDEKTKKVEVTGDKKDVINRLVRQYEELFGLASVEVCKDAVKKIVNELPKEQVPPLLLS